MVLDTFQLGRFNNILGEYNEEWYKSKRLQIGIWRDKSTKHCQDDSSIKCKGYRTIDNISRLVEN